MTGRADGFTLVEMLVAFAILATASAVLLQVFGGGPRAAGQARSLRHATLLAESVLERVGGDILLAPGTVEGRGVDGLRWQVTQAPHGTEAERLAWPVDPYRVRVAVLDGSGEVLSLSTLRLAAREPGR